MREARQRLETLFDDASCRLLVVEVVFVLSARLTVELLLIAEAVIHQPFVDVFATPFRLHFEHLQSFLHFADLVFDKHALIVRLARQFFEAVDFAHDCCIIVGCHCNV